MNQLTERQMQIAVQVNRLAMNGYHRTARALAEAFLPGHSRSALRGGDVKSWDTAAAPMAEGENPSDPTNYSGASRLLKANEAPSLPRESEGQHFPHEN